MNYFLTILLLVIANIFMTIAWYGHLKFGTGKLALPLIILISWGIALIEYCFQVPANRIGYLEHGERSGKAFFIANATDRPMRLRCASLSGTHFRVEAPATLAPGEEARVEAWCETPADPQVFATLRATLEIVPEGARALRTLPLKALCLTAAPESDDAPRLRSGTVQLRRRFLSRKLQGTLELANDGRSDLVLHALELPEGVSCAFSPGTRIAPGQSVSVKLTGSPVPGAAPARAGLRMTVFSNDPLRPAKELSININHK